MMINLNVKYTNNQKKKEKKLIVSFSLIHNEEATKMED